MGELVSLFVKYANAVDYLIWGLGGFVLLLQSWHWLWCGQRRFPQAGPQYERARARMTFVVRVASLSVDLFPLLGLLGTVGALLVTFAGMGSSRIETNIIASFAPGLTSTISGLLAAIANMCLFQLGLLPTARRNFPRSERD